MDVGAHLGSFTIPMAKRVSGGSGHGGRVLSFEPQADLYQVCCLASMVSSSDGIRENIYRLCSLDRLLHSCFFWFWFLF